jgi:enoyl-CoA hydratase/carnithine racemase
LRYERQAATGWIIFDRPQAMNAFDSHAYAAAISALADAANDAEIRSVVLLGEGGRAFSAGADLKELAAFDTRGVDPDAAPGAGMGGTQFFDALAAFPKPLIAAIDGYCLAGGLEVAALCDVRVATAHSTFALPEARLGLLPGPGLVELSRLIPLGEALRIQLTGRPITAQRAYEIGFVQAVLDDRVGLLTEVAQIADDIARGAPLAIAAYKHIVKSGRDLSVAAANELRDEMWDRIRHSEDRFEGPRAFTEKRAPRWTGR